MSYMQMLESAKETAQGVRRRDRWSKVTEREGLKERLSRR